MKYLVLYLVAVLLCFGPHPAHAAQHTPPVQPGPDDFAYSLSLPEAREQGIYQLALPESVYLHSAFADGRDIRVFNAAGEPVPQSIRTAQPPAERREQSRSVPFFPLCSPDAGADPHDFSLEVRTREDGSIIRVERGAQTAAQKESCWHLLDLTRMEQPVSELEIVWQADGQQLVGIVLESSTDLHKWQPLATGTLAQLEYSGRSIRQNRIALPPASRRPSYVRLRCPDCSGPLHLQEVLARHSSASPPAGLHWLNLAAVQVQTGSEGRDYFFTAPAALQAQSARLRLTEENSIGQVELASRPDSKSEWELQSRSLVYAVQANGLRLENPDIPLDSRQGPFWRLRVASENMENRQAGGKKAPAPGLTLALGWRPGILVFLAKGPAPYTLAYGKADMAAEALTQNDLLLQVLEQSGTQANPQSIQAGEERKRQGEAALQLNAARAASLPWPRIGLWLMLGAGVALLAFMAKKLYQELAGNETGRQNKSSQDDDTRAG